MEGLAVLVVILVVIVPLGVAIWLISRAVQSGHSLEELARRVGELEVELHQFKREPKPVPVVPPASAAESAATPTMPAGSFDRRAEPTPAKPTATPPPLQPRPGTFVPPPKPEPVAASAPQPAAPPLPVATPKPAPEPPRPAIPAFNWEKFMGVKMFAWVGGLAAFLGVAFFVKYSFDNNLISPELRVAIGFLTGLALLVGGVVLHRRQQYTVGAQALCATGVVILYAITFAARAYYHFLSWPGVWWDALPAFAIMGLITATGFLLAVRLNALVVAILGMLGGFLTPILLSTGVDSPLGLFGYIAILDAGLIFVALNRRWHFLTALAAVGTALMQMGWAGEFFASQNYFEGNKVLIALAVLLSFNALYLAATWWAKKKSEINWWLAGSALGLAAVALAFTGWFLSFAPLAQRPWLMFSFVIVIDLGITAVALLEKRLAPAQSLAGMGVFLLLASWTGMSLTNDLLNAALVFYFLFAVFHAAFPVVLQRQYGLKTTLWGAQLFPPLALLLVLIPIFKLADLSFAVWPFVLLVDLLAMGLALLTMSLLPVLAVLLLTLAATGALIGKIPHDLTGLPTSFFLLGAFAVFFVVASVWLVRKLKPAALARGINFNDDFSSPENLAALLPAFSAVLPFLLLIMATLRLPLANPSPVFGVALLLVLLLLGVTRLFSHDFMPAIALACLAALEATWHSNRFDPANATQPLTWYLGFFAVFALFPFGFLKKFRDKTVPWATAALVGLPQFLLVYQLVKAAWPNEMMGLLPAAFAIPPLLSLVVVLKTIPAETKARLTQLALFGGVGLFFITLIFPIQFDKQWITIGWALEGAALLWLFQRVPHPGLRITGFGLLVAAFVRLALNPAVLEYHVRSATPIWNWYLYSYGLVTLALFLGARLLASPRNLIFKSNVPPLLATLGTVLAFLLLNIEIADAFTPAGELVRFQSAGNFAPEMMLKRNMTYSIAWGLFALTLLVMGIVKKIPPPRYAAIALLSVTVLKLFFYDLAALNSLYRIGALIGVAVIATVASLAYQRFFAAAVRGKEAQDATAK